MSDGDFEHYDEFEPYKDSVRDAEFQFLTNNLQRNEWSIRHLDIDHIHIQYGIEGAGGIADGSVRTDGWVYFFQTKGARARTNGQVMRADTAFIIAPGDIFRIATESAHNWFSLFIPNALLFEDTKSLENTLRYSNDSRLIRLTPAQLERIEAFEEKLTNSDIVVDAATSERLVETGRKLLASPAVYQRGVGRRPVDRSGLLLQATTYIESAPQMSPRIEDLVAHCGVSERTLRNAFQEYFGIPPKSFVLLRRLHACRELLREARRGTTVTTVASKFGFWDFGRFAARYKTVFGEQPSETLSRGQATGAK